MPKLFDAITENAVRLVLTSLGKVGLGLLFTLLVTGCASYYQRTVEIDRAFQNGQYGKALAKLKHSPISKRKRNALLMHLNTGMILQAAGRYEESNSAFEKAYIYVEDSEKRNASEILTYVANPMLSDYAGEQHEIILLHYFKALNFLNLGKLEEALVEVRRMDNKMKRLSTLYKNENRYKEDAFIHLMMGLIYEASNDYNNAFIAYRNALNIYQGSYSSMFGVGPPNQLKFDLIKTARLSGFDEDAKNYERQFGLSYQAPVPNSGTVIFLWHNGMAPVKAEKALTLVNGNNGSGVVSFNDDTEGFTFSVPMPSTSDEAAGLTDLRSIRIAVPYYVQRQPVLRDGSIAFGGFNKQLELVENINAIAPKVLRDRLGKELSKTVARVALKKASEYALRKAAEAQSKKDTKSGDNNAAALQGAALALMAFNTISEKADTRNWQLIPGQISYTRVSIKPGSYPFEFFGKGNGQSVSTKDSISIAAGETKFYTIRTTGVISPIIGR